MVKILGFKVYKEIKNRNWHQYKRYTAFNFLILNRLSFIEKGLMSLLAILNDQKPLDSEEKSELPKWT